VPEKIADIGEFADAERSDECAEPSATALFIVAICQRSRAVKKESKWTALR
jgi:rhamnogalacturonyl hydrolase YesR